MPEEEKLSTEQEAEMLKLLETETKEASPAPEPPEKAPPKKKTPPKSKGKGKGKEPPFSMFKWLEKAIGYNIGEIFGDTGSGKTKTCQQIAIECAAEGKKVKFVDHEGNLDEDDITFMKSKGITYKLMSRKDDLYNIKKEDLKGYDLLIIDSATLAITGCWHKMNMQGKGKMLQELQGMLYRLSQHCIETKKHIVLITAQPISVMGDRKLIQPTGDKSSFMVKEIYYIEAPRGEDGFILKRRMVAFRSRKFPDGKLISTIKTQKRGVDLDKKHMLKILAED